MATNGEKPIVSWRSSLAWIVAIGLLLAAISTHFVFDHYDYVPKVRSTRRLPFPPQFEDREINEIEQEVRELWGQLEAMMTEGERNQFNPPASEEEIRSLEYLLGSRLPPDFRVWLKIHNGSRSHLNCLYQTPLSINMMKFELDNMDGYIDFGNPLNAVTKKVYNKNLWRPGLALFCEGDGAGNAVDCSTGKIIYWDHDGWYFREEAANFTEFLRQAVKQSSPGDLNW